VTAVPDALARARELVTPALEDAVRRLAPGVREVADYHFGFAEGHATGKAVRPALALLSAEAAGAPAETGLAGAVAVELAHNFSLLHDDIMDGDGERHHRATAWAVFGEAQAILAGDALATLSVQVLLDPPSSPNRLRAAALLAEATQRMIDGQAQDLALEGRSDVTLEECLAMLGAKTGALLECSSAIGAVLAGASDSLVERLRAFGAHVGIAFQAVDDQLGIWGAPELTGKPTWSDLRQRKSSLPVAAALQADGDELRSLLAREQLSEEELARAAALVDGAGGRRWAAEEAKRRLDAALNELESDEIAPEARHGLAALARFIVERDF
jgi:geranylgeranyl diphosphate synthase, type I